MYMWMHPEGWRYILHSVESNSRASKLQANSVRRRVEALLYLRQAMYIYILYLTDSRAHPRRKHQLRSTLSVT
jgi:hypothetical protein